MSDEADSGPEAPASIPDHQLVRRIGQGSYGEVWLARTMMGTYRAVKIVHRKAFQHDRPFERELAGIQKFEPISRSHEGFIDVLQVGQNREAGYFYYVMEIGDDEQTGQTINPESYSPKTLAKELTTRGMSPFEECLQIGLSLSNALAHLHQRGLIHRDVKPSNIILVNGIAKLADIGLVADISEARSYVGTEGFIPPEGPGTPQADIYSLGKVLYEISTGKDRLDFPQLPVELGELADPTQFLELNEVILKACQSDLRKRYQSAEDMHADLLVLQQGKSVRRLRLLEQRWASLTRVGAIGAVIGLILLGIGFQINRERKRTAEARQRQVGSEVAYGLGAMEGGDLLGSLPSFVEALRLDQGDTRREDVHRLRLGAIFAQCPKLVQMWFQERPLNWAEFSPDGQRVVTASLNGPSQVRDALSGQAVSAPFGEDSETAAFSPNGLLVVTASTKHRAAFVWEAASGKNTLRLPHPDRVSSAAFSADGQRIVTGCCDNKAYVWNALTGNLELELGPHGHWVRYAAFSPDERLIVTTSFDKTAQLWEAKTGLRVGPPLQHNSWVYHASFSPDGRRVVTACFDRRARVWDVATGRELLPAMTHSDGVRSAEFSPDGCFIVTACWDSTARLWDANTQQRVELNPILKHSYRVMHASFSPDGHRLVTASVDGVIRVWDLAGRGALPRLVGGSLSADGSHFVTITNDGVQVWPTTSSNRTYPSIVTPQPVREAKLSRNGRIVATISAPTTLADDSNRTLQLWDAASGKSLSPALPFADTLTNICVSNNGRFLAAFSGNIARLYDAASGKQLCPPMLLRHDVVRASFSPDSERLVLISGDEVDVRETATGRAVFPTLKHPAGVSHAGFSPDSRLLVTCSTDPTLNEREAYLWSAISGKRVGNVLRHHDGVLYAAFSFDGQRVVTASEDFTASVWSALSGKRLLPPLQHEDQVAEASFSQDGRWIITASLDQTARVWDAETGEPLSPPLRHPWKVYHAAFVNAGYRVYAAGKDGTAWLWDLPRDDRPSSDLALISQLLSGYRASYTDAEGDPAQRAQRALRGPWDQMHAAYPSDFIVSREEVLTWHRRLAELCETNRQWFSARFHLERLRAMEPDDPTFSKRFAQAQEQLATEQKNSKSDGAR